ncbi:DNA polymerase-3 subunit alpha (Gram-positive type) [Aequitasia blattaphilus]|uniref:DNA polymerase III PolC-type n=1 Tax=Aequitasia blattaphilus TaxID=2949332 RepID=A0ABT1EBT7_9FIRM|nr:PolC-type DNA polymerase III [Aequitasia blattaphilus]MCP1102306.1 PolC-type DNA polymerase III [Aequitasia blattaphilus]MCR8614946.1 PolC-type DNA polymerase III [Aequitasia blattaphilus]
MSKAFFDVFTSLKLNSDLTALFLEVQVNKVTTTSRRDCVKIYLESSHILPKGKVYQTEDEIKKQLFPKGNIKICIIENYSLSALYTTSYIMEEYYDSFSIELGQKSLVLKNMFQNAKITFDGSVLMLEVPDNIVMREKEKELITYLRSVYTERFSLPVEIKTTYNKEVESVNKDNDRQIQQEIREILKQSKPKEPVKQTPGKATGRGGKGQQGFKRSKNDPTLVWGRPFDEDSIDISRVGDNSDVTIRGKVISVETREISLDRTIISFAITDYTDTIMCKIFAKSEDFPDLIGEIKKGACFKIKGLARYDTYANEVVISLVLGMKIIADFVTRREDKAVEKRVELHCHTKMSDMDAISSAKDLVKLAHGWGHKAIAITDHGVVQAFPEAHHVIEDIRRENKEDPFKVIYGVEGYLVDDLKDIAIGETGQTLDDTYVVFDLETTGFSSIKDKIIEIGAVKIQGGKIVDTFSSYVNPKVPIPYRITQLTSITDQMVLEAPLIEEILPKFLDFIGESVLVAHNASFDVGFIQQNMRYMDIYHNYPYLDTVALARILLPQLSKYKLNVVAKALGIPLDNHHRAIDDANATAEIFVHFLEMLKKREVFTLKDLNRIGAKNINAVKKERYYHVIILAKNEIGRVNLYRLISKSHLEYYYRKPRIPKSELSNLREGLIVGSACEAGELIQAMLSNSSSEKIARIVDYYDYLEVQPIGNNSFMIKEDRFSEIQNEEDLRNINRRIVELGEKMNKPVVATCDVHFMEPKDEVYRKIIMAGKGFSDADDQPPLYFHTTEEMLEEFEYLGSKKAKEIVVDNTNKIADMIEDISPIHPDKCPPVIENSDEDLKRICYEKAHSMYGNPLPPIVEERLERELHSIISNGYAVMYIIAQKLVWKSVEDGYLVGSRGSVGSSFAATMAGITEVNPLSPHYYCKKCHYSDFDSEEVKAFAGGCGWDMEDKNCPNCGEPLVKDGFDTPFETFLGFMGDKEPDIDLNFSGEYQSTAHKYTEEIFGEGQTFRAGTIGTLAEKTAFSYVKKYYEEKGINKRNVEIDRLAKECVGIRRSTGQHPGGIIVLPHGRDINEFTPVQHPANDMSTDTITTHFDYHSIDSNLLKLDILGHDDPTMIKSLESYINSEAMDNEYNEETNPFHAVDIPLDDPDVMSLFHHTKALGIRPEDISGTKLGCLGIPEFGTDFVIQMVLEAKPTNLSDLIRISGLSHGTDVWLNNAQDLIRSGQATISTAICTRDDIMTFLINQGMDPALSFNIMEKVRKGKGLTPDQEEAMKESNIPPWYIESCKKIKYMFPKAHAAAYVMMAYRIAYCKINYPLAYYGSYFGIRADAFNYELMCQGKERLKYYMEDYKARSDELTKKEQDTLKDMQLVQEMYARGYEFEPINIYQAKANRFVIVNNKLMPPLSSIEGMGEKAAEAVEEASKDGKYLSIDDFRIRTKVSKTVIETMENLDLFGDIPKSNQMSIFDL